MDRSPLWSISTGLSLYCESLSLLVNTLVITNMDLFLAWGCDSSCRDFARESNRFLIITTEPIIITDVIKNTLELNFKTYELYHRDHMIWFKYLISSIITAGLIFNASSLRFSFDGRWFCSELLLSIFARIHLFHLHLILTLLIVVDFHSLNSSNFFEQKFK